MTVLIELKEKLKEFYGSCSGIVLPIVKFLLALAVFRGINSNLGYLKMLNSMYVVLILSLICAILPLNGFPCNAGDHRPLLCTSHGNRGSCGAGSAGALVSISSLCAEGCSGTPFDTARILASRAICRSGCLWSCRHAALCIFSSLRCRCLLYVRHDSRKMEPLLHAAEAPEITAVVQEFFNGLFRNEEMLLVLIACALTVLLVNAIRHSSADYAWQISIVAGSVAYAVIMIAGSLALDVQIALPMVLIGAAAGCLVGFVLEFFLFGADYTRTEYLEYDDDDYYYYVKAVPKFNVTKAQRRVTYIRNEKKKEPDLTDEELDALANLGHTEESGNSRDLDEIEEKEEIEEINETEEIQEEEIPPLDEGDYQDVDYKSMLEDTLKDL